MPFHPTVNQTENFLVQIMLWKSRWQIGFDHFEIQAQELDIQTESDLHAYCCEIRRHRRNRAQDPTFHVLNRPNNRGWNTREHINPSTASASNCLCPCLWHSIKKKLPKPKRTLFPDDLKKSASSEWIWFLQRLRKLQAPHIQVYYQTSCGNSYPSAHLSQSNWPF